MSGTLSPVDSFEKEVGLKLDYRAFGNILPQNRFQVELIGSIGEDLSISTQFNNRYNEETILGYGNIVSSLIEQIPNGSIIMFPSYSLKETMLMNWEINGVLGRNGNGLQFSNGIKMYNESREQAFHDTLNGYKRDARDRQTALSCVFRGKITEGTDLPYELCRGIFVIGIPFSNWRSPVVQGIIDYYNKTVAEGAGDAWYMYDALTVVNQGIGRGIRDPDEDYCRAFLIDNRYIYRKAGVYNKLSDWIKHNVVNNSGSKLSDAINRTERFFTALHPS
jgi:regulator of telomere elongation helicase 1